MAKKQNEQDNQDNQEGCKDCEEKKALTPNEGGLPEISIGERFTVGKRMDFELGTIVAKDLAGAESYLDDMALAADVSEATFMSGASAPAEMAEKLLKQAKGSVEKLSDVALVTVPLMVKGKEGKTLGGLYFMIFNGVPSLETFENRFIMDLRAPLTAETLRLIMSDLTEIGCPSFYPMPMALIAGLPNCRDLCDNMPNPYLVCVCHCICTTSIDLGGPFIGLGLSCLAGMAALGPSAGLSAILAIPACASYFALAGIVLSFCVIGCAI